jgi:hypothetical protein
MLTFFACTHCVAMPSTVSPTRLTSAMEITILKTLIFVDERQVDCANDRTINRSYWRPWKVAELR